MKEITKTSRLAGQLERLFTMLNQDFFYGQLETPVITIQSTPRAYAHYTPWSAWDVKGDGKREINIAAGTLNRPIENTTASLLHEMVHMYNDTIANVQDTSRQGTYHNKLFKEAAEAHGLSITRSEKYGWSVTAPADRLLDWILENNIQEIKLNRNDPCGLRIGTGSHAANGGLVPATGVTTSNSRRYHCPSCGAIVRATRDVNIICGDCMIPMVCG